MVLISIHFNFNEPCLEGKQHRSKFPNDRNRWSDKLLGLVHSEVCGKMNAMYLSGGEYCLTFTDEKTRYVKIYILKHKDEVSLAFSSGTPW